MKELILFFSALIFIFCQNLQSANLPASTRNQASTSNEVVTNEDVAACNLQEPETFDLMSELKNSDNPGIHYREVVLRSEPQIQDLYCGSGVSSEPEAQEPVQLAESAPSPMIEDQVESWATLTEKWDVVQISATCEDQNRFKINPACDDSIFLSEEEATFSSQFAQK